MKKQLLAITTSTIISLAAAGVAHSATDPCVGGEKHAIVMLKSSKGRILAKIKIAIGDNNPADAIQVLRRSQKVKLAMRLTCALDK
ncbi:MAG: hypothetical protein EB101_12720 [Chitinophagia bacterium]|nr:hypothetical protein [Chitinophagia bacterium]